MSPTLSNYVRIYGQSTARLGDVLAGEGEFEKLRVVVENGYDYNAAYPIQQAVMKLLAWGTFTGNACLVRNCMSSQRGTHICNFHARKIYRELIGLGLNNDVSQLIVEMAMMHTHKQ